MIEIIAYSLISFSLAMFIASEKYLNMLFSLMLLSVSCAFLYVQLNACDVALTEAAVGACISSCLILIAISIVKEEPVKNENKIISFVVCFLSFAIISYLALGLRIYASQFESSMVNVFKQIMVENLKIKSFVTAVLADFRGIDTFCETLVIFTGCACVYMILHEPKKS